MNYSAKELALITNSTLLGNESKNVKLLVFDTRHLYSTENVAFLAITTSKNSGNKYITTAIEKGVKVIITENPNSEEYPDITWIVPENTIQFLQKLAAYHIKQFPDLKSIGITGSNGKTVVKEWIYQAISSDTKTVKSPKSFNSQIGLPLSLLQTKLEHKIGVFEYGISQPNEMDVLESIYSPEIGILTHIGNAHLSNFENEVELIEEKIKLFKDSKLIIYNGDNDKVNSIINFTFPDKRKISYGLNSSNNVYISSDFKDKSTEIEVFYFEDKLSFPANNRDEATLTNALAVICILKELHYDNDDIIQKINNLKSIEMRLESVVGTKNNLIINDSYNLDLDSLTIAYQYIKEYKKNRKALVLTDFVNANSSLDFYKEIIELTNLQNFDKIFLVGNEITSYSTLFTSETFTFENTNQLIDSLILNQLEDYLILLKGARKFEIELVKTELELQKHDTVLEINLNAILHNINVHKALLKPSTKVMAMVKANSYGLGGYEVAEFLQHHHIDYLTVAYADEGVDLRKNGITLPIMVMNPEQHSYNAIIEYNLEPEIYSFRLLDLFCEQLKKQGYASKYPIHIKLETGMHRLGFKGFELDELIKKLNTYPVKVQSIFSHLATADMPEKSDYVQEQLTVFETNSIIIISNLDYKPLRHILNSPGIANYTDYQYDMVRIGIGMIGISQNEEISKKLQNVVRFKTVISQISEVKAGETVGYGRRYSPTQNTKIATIPVGYADGIPRLVGNGIGKLKINNSDVPIVGSVCMDMLMVDISDLAAKEGDEVFVFDSVETIERFAEYCQTIPYEVLTSISRRVKRIYIKT